MAPAVAGIARITGTESESADDHYARGMLVD